MKGTYLLLIFFPNRANISIGALGNKSFKQGIYVYVGSAMGDVGSTTIVNRVRRHISRSKDKKKHWHIDYLMDDIKAIIIKLILIPSLDKLECTIAQELMKSCDSNMENFGSSDCNCKSHLFYFNQYDSIPFK